MKILLKNDKIITISEDDILRISYQVYDDKVYFLDLVAGFKVTDVNGVNEAPNTVFNEMVAGGLDKVVIDGNLYEFCPHDTDYDLAVKKVEDGEIIKIHFYTVNFE